MLITEADFQALTHTKMQWAGYEWEKQPVRFTTELDYRFEWAYWLYDAGSMILAKNCLHQNGIEFQTSYDTATDNYIIVTNYNSDIKVGA